MKIGDAGSVNPYDSIIIRDSDKLHEKFAEHMQEMSDKLKRGETQPLYQIGAQSFTLEEWDRFLENFDEAQKAIRQALEEETGEAMSEPESTSILKESDEISLQALASKSTICSHPSSWYQNLEQKKKAEAIKEDALKSARAQEAIISSETEGSERKAENDAQYRKVLAYLEETKDIANPRFAADKSFWTDFLAN